MFLGSIVVGLTSSLCLKEAICLFSPVTSGTHLPGSGDYLTLLCREVSGAMQLWWGRGHNEAMLVNDHSRHCGIAGGGHFWLGLHLHSWCHWGSLPGCQSPFRCYKNTPRYWQIWCLVRACFSWRPFLTLSSHGRKGKGNHSGFFFFSEIGSRCIAQAGLHYAPASVS
jgi:hypothetical protein